MAQSNVAPLTLGNLALFESQLASKLKKQRQREKRKSLKSLSRQQSTIGGSEIDDDEARDEKQLKRGTNSPFLIIFYCNVKCWKLSNV